MVKDVARTIGWSFRLGSGFYPYMKLVAKTTDEPPGWMLVDRSPRFHQRQLLKGRTAWKRTGS